VRSQLALAATLFRTELTGATCIERGKSPFTRKLTNIDAMSRDERGNNPFWSRLLAPRELSFDTGKVFCVLAAINSWIRDISLAETFFAQLAGIAFPTSTTS
jgi:hypothetical protein